VMLLLRHRSVVLAFLAGSVVTSALFLFILGGFNNVRGVVRGMPSVMTPQALTVKRDPAPVVIAASSSSSSAAAAITPSSFVVIPPKLKDSSLKSEIQFLEDLKQRSPQKHPRTTILFMFIGHPSYIEKSLYQARLVVCLEERRTLRKSFFHFLCLD
jgi:hypothetical protein